MISSFNDIELLNIIGKGTFGDVYLGKNKKTNEKYAVKIISKELLNKDIFLQYFNNEISILKNTSHPNLIQFKGLIEHKENYYLLTEYCNGTNLNIAIKLHQKKYNAPIKEKIAHYFILNILKGIIYLNKKNIIHRDIKSENILLHYDNDKDLITHNYLHAKIKIADFSFARYLQKNELASSMVGTPVYMDPSIIKNFLISKGRKTNGFYNQKVDVWSLGILTYVLLIGVLPFSGSNIKDLLNNIQKRDFIIPKEENRNLQLSKAAINFIDKTLNFDHKTRPSPIELLKDDWICGKFNEIYIMKTDKEIINKKSSNLFSSFWKPHYQSRRSLEINHIFYISPKNKKTKKEYKTKIKKSPNHSIDIKQIININISLSPCKLKSKKNGSTYKLSNSTDTNNNTKKLKNNTLSNKMMRVPVKINITNYQTLANTYKSKYQQRSNALKKTLTPLQLKKRNFFNLYGTVSPKSVINKNQNKKILIDEKLTSHKVDKKSKTVFPLKENKGYCSLYKKTMNYYSSRYKNNRIIFNKNIKRKSVRDYMNIPKTDNTNTSLQNNSCINEHLPHKSLNFNKVKWQKTKTLFALDDKSNMVNNIGKSYISDRGSKMNQIINYKKTILSTKNFYSKSKK